MKKLFILLSLVSFNTLAALDYVEFDTPDDPKTGYPFSKRSDFNGVCAALGRGEHLKGSVNLSNSTWHAKKDAIKVDDQGEPVKVVSSHFILKIKCKKQLLSGR
jgi:hypothetical protein